MDQHHNTSEIDEIFHPFLRAKDEAEAQHLLSELIIIHARPVATNIIRYKLGVFLDRTLQTTLERDAEDIYGQVILNILRSLRELQRSPKERAIQSFDKYVAVISHRACSDYLRKKYPERWRLKNRLRYVLTHQQKFALWKIDKEKEWVCGFANSKSRYMHIPTHDQRSQQLRDNPESFLQLHFRGRDIQSVGLDELLSSVFHFLRDPLPLDDLVKVTARLIGIQEISFLRDEDDDKKIVLEEIADSHMDASSEFDQKDYLQRLWTEICGLPDPQRVALLLNLKDNQQRNLLSLFPLKGIASIRQIADVLRMRAEELAKLWNDLPLEDLVIAKHLNLNRQQVINLRKSARERLARRMKIQEGAR